jgi:diaminohydroxyphosphoribosylaminopyrimidine deaminase/5-amino-6-(5-phosphoribosylamino)uracil reductase
MPEYTPADNEYMARALRLARRGLYTAHPNPRVGCVLVKNDTVIGEGWHRKTGAAHAEVNALADVGGDATGATAYVTLEPCSHHGKTPPCYTALIEAGVTEVVVAMIDPHPKVSGSGIAALEQAGINVRSGLMSADAAKLNEGFCSRVIRARPFVRLKVAASLDGCTAMANGESQWITGEEARADVQRIRASSGAVMVGIGTVLADDPSLTVRDGKIENDDLQPLRVVVDSQLRMPPTARMLELPGETVIFCRDDTARTALERAGAKVRVIGGSGEKVDLAAVLGELAGLRINDLLVEAGQTLAGSLLMAGLVDELVIYQAPHIMGSETRGMFATPDWQELQQKLALKVIDVRQVGVDSRITLVVQQGRFDGFSEL